MQNFTKAERLCSKVLIGKLVEEGSSFNVFPFRVTCLEIKEVGTPVQVMISVPKRLYKRAVDRNRIKRQIREAYRKNKSSLYGQLGERHLLLMFVFTSKTKVEYSEIEEKIIASLQRLSKQYNS